MDDTEFQTPIPWGLVEHVQRTKSGRTTMQINLSIETRARMALAASQLNVSKLCLIRSAISQVPTGSRDRPAKNRLPGHKRGPVRRSPGTCSWGALAGIVLVPVTPGTQGPRITRRWNLVPSQNQHSRGPWSRSSEGREDPEPVKPPK